MSRLRVTGALAAVSISLSAAAQTFTDTAVMPVALDIVASCTVSAADLHFGRYIGTSATPSRGQSAIELQCTSGLTVDIGLDAGQGAGATTSDRRLMSGAGALRYGLFQDPARRINWGNTAGVDTVEVSAAGTRQIVTIYGEVPAGQQVPAGTYNDVITIHLFY